MIVERVKQIGLSVCSPSVLPAVTLLTVPCLVTVALIQAQRVHVRGIAGES